MPIDPQPLPDWLAELIDRPRAKVRHAPAAVELDTPIALEAAVAAIKRWEPANGTDEPSNTYPKAARLKDLGVSPATAVDLMMDWWCPHFDRDWLEALVEHVWSYGQNDAGSDRPLPDDEAFGATVTDPWTPGKSKLKLVKKGGAKPVEWLWPGYLARGMFHILAGDPGAGKSTMAFQLAAVLSTGGKWPDGTPAPIGDTLIWSSEDPWDYVIEPRLRAAGANLERINAIDGIVDPEGTERSFDPAKHVSVLLDHALQIPDLRLLVLDPVVSAVAGDDHHNNDVRRALAPLVEFAERRGVTVLGISHFTKNSEGRSTLDRVLGSRGYGALARMVLAAGASEDRKRRILVRAKSSIGEEGDGFEYAMQQCQITVSAQSFKAQTIQWGKKLMGPARELLNEIVPKVRDRKIDKARALILDKIAELGSTTTPALRIAAEEAGISWATMKLAREALGELVTVRHAGHGDNFEWRLAPPITAADDFVPW